MEELLPVQYLGILILTLLWVLASLTYWPLTYSTMSSQLQQDSFSGLYGGLRYRLGDPLASCWAIVLKFCEINLLWPWPYVTLLITICFWEFQLYCDDIQWWSVTSCTKLSDFMVSKHLHASSLPKGVVRRLHKSIQNTSLVGTFGHGTYLEISQ